MILKKPYAFLIRHFRIIHAILLLCSGYLVAKTWNVVGFFGGYIKNNQQLVGVEDLSAKYINSWMNLLPIVIILVCGIIIYLLNYKKKPIMLYVYIGIIYALLFLFYRYLDTFLYGLTFDKPSIRFVNILRDVYRVLTVIQLPVVVFAFIRTIGFDVKKFDFKKDLLDLGVEDVDNEEYEVEFKLDKEDIQAKINKRIRMFKYFYKENRFLIRGGEAILGAIIIVLLATFIFSREKIYKQNRTIDMGDYKVKVTDTYKTTTNSRGTQFNNKYFYLIAKVEYQNKTSSVIYPSNVYLGFEDSVVRATTEMNNDLTEFGVNYYGQSLDPQETRSFVYIFEVPIEYYDSKTTLRFLKNVRQVNNELKYDYKKVKLNPKEFSEKASKKDTVKLGEKLSLSGSIYGDTKITISDMKIDDLFYYNIVKCVNSVCTNRLNTITASQNQSVSLTLMQLKMNLDYDYDTLGKNYNIYNFINKFGSIRFEINGKEYNNRLELIDVTPYDTNEYVYVQVREKLKQADKIYLDLTIRDKVYTIILKDDTAENTVE